MSFVFNGVGITKVICNSIDMDRLYINAVKVWSRPYDLTLFSYSSISFSMVAQDGSMESIYFSTDGTKMYTVGSVSGKVYQYHLSTAWDVSTASYSAISFSVLAQDSTPYGIVFSIDGTKMYVVGVLNDKVYQYSLSTAWDISTASYGTIFFSVAIQETNPTGISFSLDGTKMYVVGNASDNVYQYALGTAWNVSTAVYSGIAFSTATQDTNVSDIYINPQGTKMYLLGNINRRVYEYNIVTAWDLSTSTFVSSLLVSQDTDLRGITFGNNGASMYIVGVQNDAVYQYDE